MTVLAAAGYYMLAALIATFVLLAWNWVRALWADYRHDDIDALIEWENRHERPRQ